MAQGKFQEMFGEFVQTCVMGNGELLTKTGTLFTDDNIKITNNFLRAIKPLFDNLNKDANKNKKNTWGIGDIFDGSVFGDDFEGLDNVHKNNKRIIIEILLHCNWLMYLCSDRQHKQEKASEYYKKNLDDKYFKVNTEWAIGATFSSISLDAMLFILELILVVRNNIKGLQTQENYIEEIEALCNNDSWKNGLKWTEENTSTEQTPSEATTGTKKRDRKTKNKDPQTTDNNQGQGKETDEKNSISTDAIINIILFFCNTEKYLSIPANSKKNLINRKLKNIFNNIEDIKESGFVVKDGEGKVLGVFNDEGAAETKVAELKEKTPPVEVEPVKISDLLGDMSEIDKNLFLIREKLRELGTKDKRYQEPNPFWHASIRPFWDDSTENLDKDQLSDRTLLEYKKAMILYGPPGTSKSYQARKMAEGMIAEALRNQNNDISKAIDQLQGTIDSHIHILQMHPNYTYDDFIIGKSIGENSKIIVKPGKMLQIIKDIKNDNIPHFVILDEINRVDISRVFGELFTAMEASYRDKGVELSVDINDIPSVEKEELENNNLIKDGKLYLKVPENMYFIGTMNMIDFSLEQVDFALRRRFLWRLSTYDPKRLDEIISEKVEKEIAGMQEKVENTQTKNSLKKELNTMIGILRSCPDNFSKTCTDLNNEIEWENSLGKSYLIGHAFFSEIVDIVKQVKDKDWNKAKNILWQVSILPTLEAYCGTMDANMQETFLGNCKKAFFPEPKEEKNK